MPPSNQRSTTYQSPEVQGGRGIGWAIYGIIVLVAFVSGVVAGNVRPKTIEKTVEVVKNVPVEAKAEVKPP